LAQTSSGSKRMAQNDGLNRRAFLKNAGLTALVGAVGTDTSLATGSVTARFAPGPNGKYDFDTPYNRIGTDSIKWDSVIRTHGMDHIVGGMGSADMDFEVGPA